MVLFFSPPGDVRRRHLHRKRPVSVGSSGRVIPQPRSVLTVRDRGDRRHDRHEDVRQLVGEGALPDQLRLRVLVRRLLLLPDDADEANESEPVSLKAGDRLRIFSSSFTVMGSSHKSHD